MNWASGSEKSSYQPGSRRKRHFRTTLPLARTRRERDGISLLVKRSIDSWYCGRCYRVGDDGVSLCFRMGRAEAHLTELREATMPTRRAMVSTQSLLPNQLLVRSS